MIILIQVEYSALCSLLSALSTCCLCSLLSCLMLTALLSALLSRPSALLSLPSALCSFLTALSSLLPALLSASFACCSLLPCPCFNHHCQSSFSSVFCFDTRLSRPSFSTSHGRASDGGIVVLELVKEGGFSNSLIRIIYVRSYLAFPVRHEICFLLYYPPSCAPRAPLPLAWSLYFSLIRVRFFILCLRISFEFSPSFLLSPFLNSPTLQPSP
jgi:hypothetical protein